MPSKNVTEYPGEKMDVRWHKRLCIHVGECGRAQGELFIDGRQPWCQPDLASTDEVADVIERCPSGALTCHTKDGRHTEIAATQNTVQVTYNGPLFVRGDLALDDAPDDMPGVGFRVALCRCGKSARKPFCDNSHLAAKFEDSGAVGQTGSGITEPGGPLRINPTKDGPFLLNGNVSITASTGRLAWQGDKVALCRCGGSGNKPFCDGSHKRNGFKSG